MKSSTSDSEFCEVPALFAVDFGEIVSCAFALSPLLLGAFEALHAFRFLIPSETTLSSLSEATLGIEGPRQTACGYGSCPANSKTLPSSQSPHSLTWSRSVFLFLPRKGT